MIVAVGQALVVLTRNIDLSVGSTLALSAYVAAAFLRARRHSPLVLAAGLGMVTGLLLGLVNGVLVGVARVLAIVAALGTLFVCRGVLSVLAGGGKQVNPSDLPPDFVALANRDLVGVPLFAWMALVVVVMLAVALKSLRRSRELYAIGSLALNKDNLGKYKF